MYVTLETTEFKHLILLDHPNNFLHHVIIKYKVWHVFKSCEKVDHLSSQGHRL